MSELLEKQLKFCQMIATLIQVINNYGYACKFGYALRCSDCPVGKETSLHKSSLAVDLLLFKPDENGNMVWLKETKDYEVFGLIWESMGGSWGGRFQDGNHFSLAHGGRK